LTFLLSLSFISKSLYFSYANALLLSQCMSFELILILPMLWLDTFSNRLD
jgi:hypothetical protein